MTQETYETLKKTLAKLKIWNGDTKPILYKGTIQEIYDLLEDVVEEEEESRKEMTNVPDRIFLNIGDDVPKDADFNELDEVTWSKERAFNNDIEYIRKESL